MTYLLSLTDARDLQAGQLLAVTGPTAGTSLVLVRADGDLRALFVPDDLGGDFPLGQFFASRVTSLPANTITVVKSTASPTFPVRPSSTTMSSPDTFPFPP